MSSRGRTVEDTYRSLDLAELAQVSNRDERTAAKLLLQVQKNIGTTEAVKLQVPFLRDLRTALTAFSSGRGNISRRAMQRYRELLMERLSERELDVVETVAEIALEADSPRAYEPPVAVLPVFRWLVFDAFCRAALLYLVAQREDEGLAIDDGVLTDRLQRPEVWWNHEDTLKGLIRSSDVRVVAAVQRAPGGAGPAVASNPHRATQSEKSNSVGKASDGVSQKQCRKCKQVGHFKRNCPN